MSHEVQDRVSLALGTAVARGLAEHPEWIAAAISNLDRWSTQNQSSPALLVAYQEWRVLLSGPVVGVVEVLTGLDERARRLRQNSPFAGVLLPEEVWKIKERLRHDPSAA